MKKLMLGGVALLVVLVGSQLVIEPENTIFARLGRLGGEFESQWVAARANAVAQQNELLREAEARVERRNLATQRALEIEADVAKRQVSKINSSTWIKGIGANIADTFCGLSAFAGPTTAMDTETAYDFCAAGDQLRESIAEDYRQAIGGKRTDTMRELTEKYRDAEGAMKK